MKKHKVPIPKGYEFDRSSTTNTDGEKIETTIIFNPIKEKKREKIKSGSYIQYADGTIGKIGQSKKFKRSNASDAKRQLHKEEVCSELAEQHPFHLNDFKYEYEKMKWHFLENKLKGKLKAIAEFASSVNCRIDHVGNFLIENKSTS